MKKRYIGGKKILVIADSGEKTPGGVKVMDIEYVDGTKESLSALIVEQVVSSEACDLTELRVKRLYPVTKETLKLWLNWGVKADEVEHLCQLIATSISENANQAILRFWKEQGADLLSVDAVDLITIDRVLREKVEDEPATKPSEDE